MLEHYTASKNIEKYLIAQAQQPKGKVMPSYAREAEAIAKKTITVFRNDIQREIALLKELSDALKQDTSTEQVNIRAALARLNAFTPTKNIIPQIDDRK